MKQNNVKLTTAQFAKLHKVNRRTLHYYDNIGLFPPNTKGENGYRYFDLSQSIDFEYIHMLKELNMTIQEIGDYYANPNSEKFLKIVDAKRKEIDIQIEKLKHIKKVMQTKKEQILFCETLQNQEIRIENCKEKKLYILPFDFDEEDIIQVFSYIRDEWSMKQIRMGIGGFIALEKIINNRFEKYDGLFTPALDQIKTLESITMPKGSYLCGYQKGTWGKLPNMYQKMFSYAKEKHLDLTGNAYELGLNEFVISSENEYITKIMIQIKEKN